MARIDDYINAKKIAVEALSVKSFNDVAGKSGFESDKVNIIKAPFLDRMYNISFPDFEFKDDLDEQQDVPIQEQVIILHYLMSKETSELKGKKVAYREIKGASFYNSAFVKRAVEPLKKVFGSNIKGFEKVSKQLNGRPSQPGDAGFEFYLFPNVPVQLVLWAGDDEFPSEANFLFDETIENILSPEDIAWLSGMLVYRMIKLFYA